MKIGKVLFILGIAIVASSVSGYHSWGRGSGVDLDEYEGNIFLVGGNFELVVRSRDGCELNVFILTGEDVLQAIADGSLANATPLYFVENTLYFETVVEVSMPGWYGVIVTPSHNVTADYDIDFKTLLPSSVLFFYGTVCVFMGMVLLIVFKARDIMPHVRKSTPAKI